MKLIFLECQVTKFLRDESFCDPSFINRDDCLIKLLEPCHDQTQLMTKQCLEIVFGRLKMVTRFMLHDHLDDGKYGQANNLDDDIWSQKCGNHQRRIRKRFWHA